MLQPSIVVLEDVDLIAQHRGYVDTNPLLFDVLNQMDGIDEDADVSFLLTTNRADLLEPAGGPTRARGPRARDPAARRRGAPAAARTLRAGPRPPDLDIDTIVRRIAGVTASFVKELVRKASLLSALEGGGDGAPMVTDRHLALALDELLADESEMTRALLGGAPGSGEKGTDWLLPGPAQPSVYPQEG
jgi:ATP-dependent 26S proteasome regulatory subunit